MAPQSLRNRTPRYQDFIDGVKVALASGETTGETSIKMFCEMTERADRLETLVNSTKKPYTAETPDDFAELSVLITDYYNWRALGKKPTEWLRHAELPATL